MKKIYILFETDNWTSTYPRILLGAFSSPKKAEQAFKDNERLGTMQIVECDINKFEE